MPKFSILISVVILTAALLLIFDKLFTTQPIRITLQSGQEVTTSTAEYFTLAETLLLITSAFLVGAAATYIYFNSDRPNGVNSSQPAADSSQNLYGAIFHMLKADEKQIISALRESGGELNQNKLAVKFGISKVKATRILYRLEQKRLITKERLGLTNRIKLDKILLK